jgi:hypothetical protein
MGPFDVKRQLNRRRAVRKILANPDLPEASRDVWLRIYNNLTLDEDEYNRRVEQTYANHKQEIVEWNH